MILLIDNYDSFTYNLVQGLEAQGAQVTVRVHDDPSLADVQPKDFTGLLLGPGPGRPEGAGCLMDVLALFYGERPILGVCLGMQALALYHGARVESAPEPFHGRIEAIGHDGRGLFRGLPSPFKATRYHSLCVRRSSLPEALEVSATSADGVVMALRDRQAPVEGFQFHPESVASSHGPHLLGAFVRSLS